MQCTFYTIYLEWKYVKIKKIGQNFEIDMDLISTV